MSGDVYVGNLPFFITEAQIKEHFKPAGQVHSVQLMTDRKGRSRCFGFVTVENPEEAISLLDQKELHGRRLRVSRAIPNTPVRPGHHRFHRRER